MWKLKYDTNELTYETETDRLTGIENSLWFPSGWEVGKEWTGSLGLAGANHSIEDG